MNRKKAEQDENFNSSLRNYDGALAQIKKRKAAQQIAVQELK